ncbi:MAG: (2Fe-2S)-binding protein [Blastocatellia bacterium]
MSSSDDRRDQPSVSRRTFLKGTGVAGVAGVALTIPAVPTAEAREISGMPAVTVIGPEKGKITLTVNGAARVVEVEPRVTLLDALRNDLDVTGAKRVCDRATCGACSILLDGKLVYGCSILAIDAEGRKIETVESLTADGTLHPVQKAFVDHDGQQCGFCTPGFVMACKSLLDRHPEPTPEQIQMGLGGNLCRCGTYVGIKEAVTQASKELKQQKTRGGRRNG